ncbi:MAG: hypothetical protein AAFW73_07255 [Bacteroidota bacterium]
MAKQKKSKVNKSSKSPSPSRSKPRSAPPAADAGLVFEPHFWSRYWLPAAFLFVLAVGLYLSTVQYEFVLDDKIVYSENNFVKKGFAGIPEIFTTESFTGYFGEQRDLIEGGRYRPLSIATFAAEYALTKRAVTNTQGQTVYEGNPAVGHWGNILLYGLTGLLLFRILSLLFPLPAGRPWYWGIAFVGTLLFIVHPIHTEVVANIKGRDEILAMLGALGALYFALAYFQKNHFGYLALSVLSFFLGLLAKENALTFIAIVPLTAYCFTRTDYRKMGLATGALLLTGVVYLVLRTQAIGFFLDPGREITDIMNNPFYGLNTGERFATVFYTLGQYLKLLVFPHPLTHDYYPYHVPVQTFADWRAIASLLLHLALGAYALWGAMKKSVPAYGILFYFITLSIVSNIPFTVGTFMNERFVYLSSLGFCILVAWLLMEYLPRAKFEIVGYGLLGLLTMGYIGKTITRVPAWKDTLSLNRAAIQVSKNSARANCFMGTALFNLYKEESDNKRRAELLDEVSAYMNRALEIVPNYGSALTMKSGIVAEYHKKDQNHEKLLAEFRSLLLIRSSLPFVRTYMDYLKGRGQIPVGMVVNWCADLGQEFLAAGRLNSAQQWLTYGLGYAPNDSRLLRLTGQMYESAGDGGRAQEFYNRAAQ